jgi:regulatory Fis family protein
MGRISPHIPISSSSRRRLVRWLVGSPISAVERDLILETLTHTHGNRSVSARLLGVSVRTLRNKITEYSAEGLDIPRHESHDEILNGNDRMSMTKESKTAEQLSA